MNTDTQDNTHDTMVPTYPAGGTRLAVRRWHDSIEAYTLRKKCGLALKTSHMPMRALSDAQRTCTMQLHGVLLVSIAHAPTLRDRFVAHLATLDDSDYHGARMLELMSNYFRDEAPEESSVRMSELRELLGVSLHPRTSAASVQAYCDRITEANRQLVEDEQLSIRQLAAAFVELMPNEARMEWAEQRQQLVAEGALSNPLRVIGAMQTALAQETYN